VSGHSAAVAEISPQQPYLSIVVTTRNDDHGGSLLRRTQTFVNALLAQCRRHDLAAELVIVEWNPPADRPRLRDALRWPADFGPGQVRFIEVPESVHLRYSSAKALPLYQMIAKNVGIRKARGQFILATNIDILFSEELAAHLARRELQGGLMYRIDRYDVMTDVPTDAPVEERLAYCETHVIRVNARGVTFAVTPDGARAPGMQHADLAPALAAVSPPSARMRWSEFFSKLKGVLRRAAGNDPVITVWVPVPGFVRRLLRFVLGADEQSCVPAATEEGNAAERSPDLHTNACGDFTLMAREHWFDLRGYPEWDLYSFDIDSVLCHAAHHGGAREVVLESPMRIYHIEHGSGSGWTPEGEKLLFERLRQQGVAWLPHADLEVWAAQMRRLNCPMIFNRENWGLSDFQFPETVLPGPR
jgi:hypothetical protein